MKKIIIIFFILLLTTPLFAADRKKIPLIPTDAALTITAAKTASFAYNFTHTGADITLTGSGTSVYTFPVSTSTLASLTLAETFTNKTLTSPILNGNVGIGTTGPTTKLYLGLASITDNSSISLDRGGSWAVTSAYNVYRTNGFTYWEAGLAPDSTNNFHLRRWDGSTYQSDAMTVLSSTGNVGIGTTSPWGRLSITGAGATSATFGLVVADSANSPKMVVRNDGNVGIGTTSPSSPLQVYGSGTVNTNPVLQVTNTASAAYVPGFTVLAPNLTAGQATYFSFGHDASTNNLASILFTYAGSGSTSNRLDYNFFGGNPLMSILANGNVGIGTTSPWAKLSVEGTSSLGNEARAGFFTATSTTATSTFAGGLIVGNGGGTNGLTVTGNVGVGTTTPSQQLSVQGNGFFSGILRAIGNFIFPKSADPTITFEGEAAINTTTASSSLRYSDGTAERSLYPDNDRFFSFASSTLTYGGGYSATGSTTLLMLNPSRPITLTRFFCKTNLGTAQVRFGDGSASTTMATCNSAGVEVVLSANNTWVMRENFLIEVGKQTDSPDWISVTVTIRSDAD